MFQKSFQNYNGHLSNRRRFHHSGRNWRSNRGKQKKVIHESAYIKNDTNLIETKSWDIKHKFSDFAIDQKLKENIFQKGFTTPTPIQDQAIALILEGKDVIGIAETGSGKTAAFLIPLIHKLFRNRQERVLIIVPTRELAVQINEDTKSLAKLLFVNSSLCIGGISINRQIFELRNNPQVVIGTPGRIKDLFNRHFLHLNTFKIIVLDEADRMVDIGFLPEIKYIISHLSKDRQSLFFSATVSSEVDGIIKSFVSNPVTISVKSNETPVSIRQDVIRVNGSEDKITKLKALLKQADFTKVLIFGRTKHGVDRLSKKLFQHGFSVAAIHGNKSQNQRLRVLSQFRENRLKILIATDIAARGLDIPDVSHVINYDEPATKTDYIHRIGRTGRAQKKGFALTFVG